MKDENTFKFDTIKSIGKTDDLIKSSFEAEITKNDYTLSFDKIAGTLSVFLIDNKMPTTLLVYTQHFTLPFGDTIQYGEDLDTLEEKKEATEYNIYLATLYLGAYKSIKNKNSIPEELINFTYQLLFAIYNKENIKLSTR